MANQEHVDILRRGVVAWNQWRESAARIWPDLLGADFPEETLEGINLQNTNLLRADLEGCNLTDANLRNANLKEANLRRATLIRADLQEANLYKAKLQEADLERARLVHASLIKAEIERTNFAFATMGETSFDQGLVLGGLGLDLVYHSHSAILDVQVFEQASLAVAQRPDLKQPIQRFFQNSGVTDRVVRAALEALSQPRKWRSCFISYSHSDKAFAERLGRELKKLDIHCHWDDQGIAQGERIFEKVASLIINTDRTLLCCSWASLTRDWIAREVDVALEKEKKEGKLVLMPLDIDGCILDNPYRPDAPQLGYKFRDRLVGNFRGWSDSETFDTALSRLTETLKIDVGLAG